MSACQMYLEDWLEEAVLQGAVTLSQAWAVQDEVLQSQALEVEMPQELWPVMEVLHFLELAPPSLARH